MDFKMHFRCISDRFGIGKATAWRSVLKVVSGLYYHLHTFIKWPSAEEVKVTWTYMKRKYGFPKVIGAIDGTHIRIAAPQINPECYVNRKGYHSLQLQVQKVYIYY
ncbi:putative nuclease HARBI1 [Odontomachus brunneus]|uniref:putative nuclease HARBI1 n=1 Tax=Odontomachus brunneus TaxID=486640 RepID=UPI0013F28F96|nr:putative nuclease HARBI1 [Odontomachus brunneus]